MDGGGKLVFVGGESSRKCDHNSGCLTKPGMVAELPSW